MSDEAKPQTSRERAYGIVYNNGDAYRSGANGGEPLVGAIESAIDAAVEVQRKCDEVPWWAITFVSAMCVLSGFVLGVQVDQSFDLDNHIAHAVLMSKSDASIAQSEAAIAKTDARMCNDKLKGPWTWTWAEDNLLATHDTLRNMPWQLVGTVDPGYGEPLHIYRHAK